MELAIGQRGRVKAERVNIAKKLKQFYKGNQTRQGCWRLHGLIDVGLHAEPL
jgi:hypothetical protein